jgi:MFS family permease
VLVLAFGSLDFGLESSIVLPALPVFAREYGASVIAVSWLATGFLLASVVAIPLLGRLASPAPGTPPPRPGPRAPAPGRPRAPLAGHRLVGTLGRASAVPRSAIGVPPRVGRGVIG